MFFCISFHIHFVLFCFVSLLVYEYQNHFAIVLIKYLFPSSIIDITPLENFLIIFKRFLVILIYLIYNCF